MPDISRRTSTFTESVIRQMTRIANRTGAVNLSQGFPDFDPPAPLQEAAVTALNFPDSYYSGLAAEYTAKRALFLAALDRAELSYITPAGAYYVMVDVSEFGVENDMAFCEWLCH